MSAYMFMHSDTIISFKMLLNLWLLVRGKETWYIILTLNIDFFTENAYFFISFN